jgi:hypothetical protein
MGRSLIDSVRFNILHLSLSSYSGIDMSNWITRLFSLSVTKYTICCYLDKIGVCKKFDYIFI